MEVLPSGLTQEGDKGEQESHFLDPQGHLQPYGFAGQLSWVEVAL